MTSNQNPSRPTVPNPLTGRFDPMDQFQIREVLQTVNVSSGKLKIATGVPESTLRRWLAEESDLGPPNEALLLKWWTDGVTMEDIHNLRSRLHPKKVHEKIEEAVEISNGGAINLNELKDECQVANLQSLPPKEREVLTERQFKRVLATKKNRRVE